MARSTNLASRRGYQIDAQSILVGSVRAGTKGRAAETRTGAGRIMTTLFNKQSEFRAVLAGQSSSSSGGYLLQFAHMPLNGVIADAAGWTTLATLTVSGQNISEAVLSGKQVHDAIYAAATTATAVTASALSSNVVTLTVASHPYFVGDSIFLTGFTSNGAPFNGARTITAVTSTTVVFALTNADIAVGGTGSIYPGRAQTLTTDELRVAAVRAVAGTGSNGAGVPAGTSTLYLDPVNG